MKYYGYVRISRDEDKENYDSIISQKRIIQQYAEEHGFALTNIIEDDNVSGYTFNRPGLNILRELVENNLVEAVLAKDLSRIGRHNAKTLLFLEFLEEHNVRLILINDSYDSEKDEDDIIGIKTWYNEKYIKDISKKIKTSLKSKQKDGLVVKVPYGYSRDPENKHSLIIDEEAAEVVKRIFSLYLDGYGGRKIANILDGEGVLTPSKYAYLKTGKKQSTVAERWHSTHVVRILKSDVYIGTLRCGKTEKKKIKGKTSLVNKEDHIIHENYHEPIISIEDFNLAQKILERRIENNVKGTTGLKQGINLFTGFLICSDCGGGFMRVVKKRSPPSYICTNNFQQGASFCSSHKVNEKKLVSIILDKLKMMRNYITDNFDSLDKEINQLTSFNQNYNSSISRYNKLIEGKRDEIKNYSKQLAQGIISEELALELIKDADRELETYNKQQKELVRLKEANAGMRNKVIKSFDIINEIIDSEELTRRNLEILIKKIHIKQLSKPLHGLKPVLNIEIEWDIFISSLYNIVELYEMESNDGQIMDSSNQDQLTSIVGNTTVKTSHRVNIKDEDTIKK